MATLSKEQINELKNKRYITQTVSSDVLAGSTVAELKDSLLITSTNSNEDIENESTPESPISITIDPSEM